jgi:hypothetical protein
MSNIVVIFNIISNKKTMKTQSKSSKQQIVSFIFFVIYFFALTSCKSKTEIVLPQNTISLKYNNQIFNFKDITLSEGYFSSPKVITAYGKIEKYEKDNLPYRVSISFKDDGTGKFLFEIIEFGVGRANDPKYPYIHMYNTAYIEGLNPVNIQTSVVKNNTEIKGEFAGKLKSLDKSVEVIDGKFSLFLETVRK